MLCDNCQKNEATLHLTTILYGREEETIQLCQDCDTEATRLPPFDPSKLQLLPIIAKKCDFCGQDAFSEKTVARNSIYLCFDCQVEYRRTFAELFFCEHADFIQRIRTRNSSPPFPSPEQFQSWLAEADEKVVQILKERRRQ